MGTFLHCVPTSLHAQALFPHRRVVWRAHLILIRWAFFARYSRTIRGKYIETTQFGTSTMELMRKSAQTLHSM